MVVPWGLEPQTSNLSKRLYYGAGYLPLMSFGPPSWMNSATAIPRVSTSIRSAYEANRFARSNRAKRFASYALLIEVLTLGIAVALLDRKSTRLNSSHSQI